MKTVYYNGNIYTGEKHVSAFVVENNEFVYVGNDKEALDMYIDNDIRYDLNGSFVCAGFNDSHMHMLSLGRSLSVARLNEHTNSKKDMYEYLKDYISHNNEEWIIGMGWNQNDFSDDKNMPNKKELDEICNDRPMYLSRCCGHIVSVNSKALEIANISKDTIVPLGGEIDYENGLLSDSAIVLVKNHVPSPDEEKLKQMIIDAGKYVNSLGITSVQSDDYTLFNTLSFETINNIYKQLEKENKLTVRVYEQCRLKTIDLLKSFLNKGLKTGIGTDMYKLGPLKLLCDGSLGARTAALTKPYHDDPDNLGLLLFTDEQLNEIIKLADENDMQIAVHAIGDKALDQLLNAYGLLKDKNNTKRHGVVHCQVSRKDQLERITDMHLHVYAQSLFLDTDVYFINDRLSSDLADTSYSWKTLMDKGITISNGSDAPVEMPEVMKGIECAITRSPINNDLVYLPDQSFTVKQAIDSYTTNSAYASFDENKKGLIKPGYLADFVLLDGDPFNCDSKQIHKIKVKETYLNGKCVYRKD